MMREQRDRVDALAAAAEAAPAAAERGQRRHAQAVADLTAAAERRGEEKLDDLRAELKALQSSHPMASTAMFALVCVALAAAGQQVRRARSQRLQ